MSNEQPTQDTGVAATAILSALAEEQQGLLELLEGARQITRAGRVFRLGNLHGQPVVLGLSRIGKVAAATTATALIAHFDVKRMVFTGVAGALGDKVKVGDVVVASGFVQHDMDASPLFPRFEIPLYGQSLFPCDAILTASLVDASRSTLIAMNSGAGNGSLATRPVVHHGLVATGDRFVSTAQASSALRRSLRSAGMDPLAVEMEGAAVAQVCLDYGIPFAAVRTISDRADDSAPGDFQHFVTHVASHYARGIVEHFLRAS